MIEYDQLSYSYTEDSPTPVLRDLSLRIEEGDLCLVAGPSGSGKSTFLRCINGLVPHFYGGVLSGRIRVAGQDPVALQPRRMSRIVGFVFQDPETQAVVNVVEDELAFAMENQGLPPATMRKRVEEALDQLNIAPLRRRRLATLSGGERQRVAIAAVLTLQPQVIVLDEPTSQLDPQAAEEVLDTLLKLNHDLGLTIVLSEHRLERVAAYADRMIYMPGPGQTPVVGSPAAVLQQTPLTPPIVDLGKRLGWSPLPLTLRDARRLARGIEWKSEVAPAQPPHSKASEQDEAPALQVQGLRFAYGPALPVGREHALRGIDLTVRRGELVAIMGRNGAGKSTLLKQCIGLLRPHEGKVRIMGLDTQDTPVEELAKRVGYVPQNPNSLLFADTVAQELEFTRRAQGLGYQDDDALLQALGLAGMAERYPRDLSTGERQRTALAAVLVGDPELILLDEPTRGLDYEQKAMLISFLKTQKARRRAIVLVTHDVELVAQCAERVILMGDGEIVVDGPVRKVMSDSQVFASQINKLFRDPRFLTVDDVMHAVQTAP